ncbi:chromosome segregation protein SMC [Spongorhabdus nitratireducens]
MRLKCIKLAGFKSFVDPTTVYFPTNMCGVVGPNGCGKSNIIDAVRWVMGESSAKNLRGESMTDVIFKGSNSRKPAAKASVELIFDNTEGKVTGEYAAFNEISVKRLLTSDSKNFYYLNNAKCRRRDIMDIFLGTGLGPRSYSIISQGIISNLIECKPEELRVFIEEAAGISKYKERRRETENRIRRTTENLERLTDLRDELERQLSHLKRQAEAAERYKQLKEEERLKKAQLHALRWQAIDTGANSQEAAIREFEVQLEASIAKQRSNDTGIEKARDEQTGLSDRFNEVQGRYYSTGNEITRLEQIIQHRKERSQQLKDDLAQAEEHWKEAKEHLAIDQERLVQLETEIETLAPELEMLQASDDSAADLQASAEEAMHRWQQEWDSFSQNAQEPRRQAEVEQSRIQHLEQAMERVAERSRRLQEELDSMQHDPVAEEIELLLERQTEAELEVESSETRLEDTDHQISSRREALEDIAVQADDLREQLSRDKGRLSSLEALQQAALSNSEGTAQWLESQQLDNKPRLADNIQIKDGWDIALETVLGDHVQAVCVDSLDNLAAGLEGLEDGRVTLLETGPHKSASGRSDLTSLASLVTAGPVPTRLASVYVADSLTSALQLRSGLEAHESLITTDGIWLGSDWLRLNREHTSESGVLARKQEIEQLLQSTESNNNELNTLESQRQTLREQLQKLEQDREQLRRTLNEQRQQQASIQAELAGKKVRVEQFTLQRQRIEEERRDIQEQQSLEQEKLGEARLLLQEALDRMEDDSARREELQEQREVLRDRLDQARMQARDQRDRAHRLALRQQAATTQIQSTKASIERLQQQNQRLDAQRQMLLDSLAEAESPSDDLELQLEALLEQRLTVEEEMAEARRELERVEHQLRQFEQERHQAEQETANIRGRLEKLRMDWQGMQVRRNTLKEQLAESNFDLQTVIDNLPEGATENEWEEILEKIGNRIQRLGAINLAAIEEYDTQSQRKKYLDAQNDDLVEALETLENAIRRIDKETRNRFQVTFEKVNAGLQELFPKVFGGGRAYLALTGEDLLDTGVTIMAQPPGKKNSTIHLLSGGEKALTAIALVFSIFQLNPSPFCMLDEVDAPLDDANVGRYARMVEEMSEKVQFIYITHNKIAMEAANQLIGVTMHEPGVSRPVSVDIEEAAAMAIS